MTEKTYNIELTEDELIFLTTYIGNTYQNEFDGVLKRALNKKAHEIFINNGDISFDVYDKFKGAVDSIPKPVPHWLVVFKNQITGAFGVSVHSYSSIEHFHAKNRTLIFVDFVKETEEMLIPL